MNAARRRTTAPLPVVIPLRGGCASGSKLARSSQHASPFPPRVRESALADLGIRESPFDGYQSR